jgi:protein Mpv17
MHFNVSPHLDFCFKMISRVSTFFRAHPMLKGMAVYSVIWPSSAAIQQLMNKEDLDWKKCFRFFLFGTFFVAPSLYGWVCMKIKSPSSRTTHAFSLKVRLSSNMWSEMTLKTGITKAAVEQFSYGPAASVSFFTIMTLLEGRSFAEAKMEVREKFPPTFQVGVCFWPFFQIINFTFIKERNRVPFVAFGSFIWCIFLSYMKKLDAQKLHDDHLQESDNPSQTFFEKLKTNLQLEK